MKFGDKVYLRNATSNAYAGIRVGSGIGMTNNAQVQFVLTSPTGTRGEIQSGNLVAFVTTDGKYALDLQGDERALRYNNVDFSRNQQLFRISGSDSVALGSHDNLWISLANNKAGLPLLYLRTAQTKWTLVPAASAFTEKIVVFSLLLMLFVIIYYTLF